MATSKSGGCSADGCSKLFKTFEMALKKSERHLLLSATYGLNNSWSKKITVGLRLRMDGSFEPVVRLINNYSSGVTLSGTAWEYLVAKLPVLEEYFEKSEQTTGGVLAGLLNDTIILDSSCALRFTTAHGSKVIAFYSTCANGVGDDDNNVNEDDNNEDEEVAGPCAKKRKGHHTPVIVMQKITFDGLKHIACCINERIRQLDTLRTRVDWCKETVVRFFAGVMGSRKIKSPTLQQISSAVCDEIGVAHETVRLQAESNFRDYYFDIVFCEMFRLFLAYIVADIRQSVMIDL